MGFPEPPVTELPAMPEQMLNEPMMSSVAFLILLERVITDIHSRYFGAELNDQSLIPGDNPRIGPTSFEAWLQSKPKK